MKHLRVTHILNVTDLIPNYFENSSKYPIFVLIHNNSELKHLISKNKR